MSTLLISTLSLAVGYVVLVWLLSLVMGRVGIIDAFWGPGFALIAVLCHFLTAENGWRRPESLLLGMIVVWGARLGVHLSIRVFSDPHEDRRYAAMRSKYEPNWWIKSLGIVFLLQGLIMWFVALPVTTSFAANDGPVIGWMAATGLVFWAVGLFFETVGDWQLAKFRADATNSGKVLNAGLWRLTRHPNYFGDCTVWWGLAIIAFESPSGRFGLIGAAVMTILLLRISGVAFLEKTIIRRRPEYVEYQRVTSAFIPRLPRRSKSDSHL